MIVCAAVNRASAQVTPLRLYSGFGREIPVSVAMPEGATGEAWLTLCDPADGEPLAWAPVHGERADLARLFPALWTDDPPRVRSVQLTTTAGPAGPALIVEPLLTPARAQDGLSARVMRAFRAGDNAGLAAMVEQPRTVREAWAGEVLLDLPGEPVFSAVRVYTERLVEVQTTEGTLTIRLRPDAAPRTAWHFRHLAEGGFYDGVPFHRVVNTDARGRRFIVQAGDPTGAGLGGCGWEIAYEPSTLAHDFGVVSLARAVDDPGSGSSQFFICLDREACAPLDGRYAAFGEVIGGAGALLAIASRRGEEPARIIRARLVDAPPAGRIPGRAAPPEAPARLGER